MKHLIYITFILVAFTACKSKVVYVPVETTKIEYKDRLQRDSIFLSDSIYIDRLTKNDTVFITKEKYKFQYRDKLKIDTAYIEVIKDVPYPVVEMKEVNRLRSWQILLMVLGGVFIGFLGYRIIRVFS